MVAVSDLWRTADELMEKFTPLVNRVFNIVNRRVVLNMLIVAVAIYNEDSCMIFNDTHDYNVLTPDSWTMLNKPTISAALTRYNESSDILKYTPNRK